MKKQLSKSEVKDINEQLRVFRYELSKKDQVMLIDDDVKIVLVNNQPEYFYYQDKIFPTLKNLLKKEILKKIVVDMGAVKFVASGADVMRPGIREIDSGIVLGEAVVIVDEKNKKPLAVGIALFSSIDMKAAASGKVIKTVHYVGDKIWNVDKED